jgi:hypothetical protein
MCLFASETQRHFLITTAKLEEQKKFTTLNVILTCKGTYGIFLDRIKENSSNLV